jgi:hypothetical protein
MAPPTPTVTYNSDRATYTKFELTGSTEQISVEKAIVKSMLARDITVFNNDTSTTGKDTTFTFGNDLMINHQLNDLGTVFALGAIHKQDEANNTTGGSGAHVSFTASSGKIGSSLSNSSTNTPVSVTNDSASYYDSQVVATTDNSEHEFYEDNEGTRYIVTFDTASTNYNAEKAVNSRYSNISGTDVLTVNEHKVFNSADSLYTENVISRNSTTNALSAGAGVTGAISSAENTSNVKYYDGLIGIDSSVTSMTSNNGVFFGSVKVVQEPPLISVTGTAVNSSSTTLAKYPSHNGDPLPGTFNESDFTNLFTSADFQYVGSGYTMGITGVTGGGYSTNFRGFDTDDSSVVRNTKYMELCSTQGQNFEGSFQTVEIINGGLTGTSSNTGANSHLLGVHADTDEQLDGSQYQSNYWVRTYFTEPSTGVIGTYHRAEGESSESITDFRVNYDLSEGSSVLSNDRRNTYYESFDIKTVIPATGLTGGDFTTGSNGYIGTSNGFSAVIADDSISNINVAGDYSFSADANLVGSGHVALLQITSQMKMANENSLYIAGDTEPVADTTVTAIGTGINLALIGGSDLRIKLEPKSILSHSLTNTWHVVTEAGTPSHFVTNISKPNLLGSDVYNFSSDIGATGYIDFTIETNGDSINRDTLHLSLKITDSLNADRETILSESQFILDGYSTPVNSTPVEVTSFSYNTSSTVIMNLLSKYKLYKHKETKKFTPRFHFAFGPYSNLEVVGNEITMQTEYYTLEKSDSSKLADSYLSYIQLPDLTRPLAHRSFTYGNTSSRLTITGADLYGFTAVVQKKVNTTWSDIESALNFDPAYNNFTIFDLGTGNGIVTVSADISTLHNHNLLNSVTLDQLTYYIELSTANKNISYNVVGHKWDTTNPNQLNALIDWGSDADNTVTSSIGPLNGTSITGLTTNVSFTSPAGSGSNTMSLQPNVTITVSDESNKIWAEFSTTNKNATSNFNVWYSAKPVFKVIEYYGDDEDNVQSTTHHAMATTATTLNIIDGIVLTFDANILMGDYATYRLLGDRLLASAYAGYTGHYSGSVTEVTYTNGLVIGDSVSRNIPITYYRGNSVKPSGSSATYEEFSWNRIVTEIQMKIVNTDNSNTVHTYTDSLSNLYVGSTHTVSDLSGSIGNLGLKFYGNRSRFSSDTLMSQPIGITFGSYNWSVSNPSNAVNNGSVLVKNVSGNKSTAVYSIVDYNGTNSINIVASRVMIRDHEDYQISSIILDLKLYHSASFVGQPNTFTWDSFPFQTITNADLISGTRQFIKLPTDANTDSIISIGRHNTAFQSHTAYFVLPRPQIIVSAVPTNKVTSLAYTYNSSTMSTSRYSDIVMGTSHHPFIGAFGEDTVSTLPTRVINDMGVQFNSTEHYTAFRKSSNDEQVPIYIPSNKVTLKLYLGYATHAGISLPAEISTIYDGYIHEMSNYDIDSSINSQTHGTKTTYLHGSKNSTNLTYGLEFSQDFSVIDTVTTAADIYGVIGNKILNIETLGYPAFMNISNINHLDLLTGDSVQLVLYGHTYKKVGNNLVAEFVRYNTTTGIDFVNISSNLYEFAYKNLGFVAYEKQTAQVIVRENTNVLTSTPYNLISDSLAAVTDSSNWMSFGWSEPEIISEVKEFTLTCLSTVGQSKLNSILGVSKRSPFRCVVCQYPNYVDIRSADGAPLYIVNGFGTLFNVRTMTHVVELSPSNIFTSTNIPDEYLAYNVLSGISL